MGARNQQKSVKGKNGVGDSVTVFFQSTDAGERRALEMAKLLAQKHGRRKAAIVALLDAMYQHYQISGEVLSSAEVYARLIAGSQSAQPASASTEPRRERPRSLPRKPGVARVQQDNKERVQELAQAAVASAAGWFS